MCGNIALVSTNKTTTDWKKRSDWFKAALVADTIRGSDGTGLAFVPHTNMTDPDFLKQAVPGPTFLENKRVDSILNTCEKYAVLMGHNRAATKGGISSVSSHPFQHGAITLCHNGTLTQWTGVDPSFTVDSEAICHAFDKNGAKETLEKLKGAYALQWYDANSKTYNIARNEQRPLTLAFSDKREFMLVASEAWMIRELAIKYKVPLDDKGVWSLNPGYILSFALDDPKKKDLSKFTYTKFNIAPTYSSTYGDYGGNNKSNFTTGVAPSAAKTSNPNNLLDNKDIDVDATISNLTFDRKKNYRERLSVWDLSLGDSIDIIDCHFTPYNSYLQAFTSGTGDVFGKVSGLYPCGKNQFLEVMVYCVKWSMALEILGNTFTGRVIACNESKKHHTLIVEGFKPNDEGTNTEILYQGPEGTWIGVEEMKELCKDGCCKCSEPIDLVDDESEWIDWLDKAPLCYDCFTRGYE